MLQPGDRFPVEKLSVQPEGPAVVYFYPADFTQGCTIEAHTFNDRYQRFRDAGYEVIGVSVDGEEKHEAFRNECGLAFPLATDEGGELSKELGILKDFSQYGMGWLSGRVTFLLDGDGVVQQVWEVADAGSHPDEVLAAIDG